MVNVIGPAAIIGRQCPIKLIVGRQATRFCCYKNIIQIERTYYGVISDAIEGCFSFTINPDGYTLKTELVENARYSDALNQAVKMEEKITEFYSDAAEQSKSLLADVPRVFTMVARKRGNRIPMLRSLLHKED